MTSSLVRGLLRSGRPIQRSRATHIAWPRCRTGEYATGLITRQWAGRWESLGQCQKRAVHNQQDVKGNDDLQLPKGRLEDFKKYFDVPRQSSAEEFKVGNTVTIHGFISKRRDISSKLSFVDLIVHTGPAFQFKSSWEEKGSPEHQLHKALKSMPAWSSVSLTGKIESFKAYSGNFGQSFPQDMQDYEVTLQAAHLLNPFPKDIIISEGAVFPPHLRHLQLRFDQVLQDRLKFRHSLTAKAQEFFQTQCFSEVETPILFKSTPEGAREFLVPTRRQGYAYALPQSPQQYKQILMAAGTRGYYQFARCFRDEDLRADRQPEFTQLDLEVSFAKGEDVMTLIEKLVWNLYEYIKHEWRVRDVDGQPCPTLHTPEGDTETQSYPSINTQELDDSSRLFPRITYQEAMSLYGSDKPDLRVPNKIQRIEHILPQSFTSMITYLENPIVEACVFRFDSPPGDFTKSVWNTLPKPLRKNPDGQPVPIIIDSSKPLSGLSSLGHEAAERLLGSDGSEFPHLGQLEEGDLLVIQARPNKPFSGGSTALGTLRNHIYQEAITHDLLPFDRSFQFLWVTGFPMFMPTDASSTDPGQGGTAGFSSTHHPFTAPLTPEDLDLLTTDPLRARADHYDLVVNGVELGGGSRRIHVAAVQEYVFREVLKMSDAGIEHFSHLLEALRAGCPPHAGFAFGWDRLVATLGYTSSVRDVIAFPKSKKGEEPVARSPGKVSDEEWAVYHLQSKKTS